MVLDRVVERAARAVTLDDLCVAVPDAESDDELHALCEARGWMCSRGSEHDVLDRYYRAALEISADVVVRMTADCPLLDPEVIDRVVRAFLEDRPDYASNTLERTYPRGLDTEVMSLGALERSWQEATAPYQRAHVTPYILEHAESFHLVSVVGPTDHSRHRWVVDVPEDLEFVRSVYAHFEGRDGFSSADVLEILDRNPSLAAINWAVCQKPVREG